MNYNQTTLLHLSKTESLSRKIIINGSSFGKEVKSYLPNKRTLDKDRRTRATHMLELKTPRYKRDQHSDILDTQVGDTVNY